MRLRRHSIQELAPRKFIPKPKEGELERDEADRQEIDKYLAGIEKDRKRGGPKIELGFKRERIVFAALQLLKQEGIVIEVMSMGMVDAAGEFNPHPTTIDALEDTGYLVAIKEDEEHEFLRLSIIPPLSFPKEPKPGVIYFEVGTEETPEAVAERMKREVFKQNYH